MAKKIYVGAPTEVPEYGEVQQTIQLNSFNLIDTYFNTRNGEDNDDYGWTENLDDDKCRYESTNWADEDDPDYDANTSSGIILVAKEDIISFTFDWSVSSEQNYDQLIILLNDTTILEKSGEETGTWTGALSKNDELYFRYVKDGSGYNGDDTAYVIPRSVDIITQGIIGTITVDTARAVNSIYVGIDNIARRIIKAYVGVGGKARPFWDPYDISYYGVISPLQNYNADMVACSLPNYGVFGSGNYSGSAHNVEAYDATLTKTIMSDLTEGTDSTSRFNAEGGVWQEEAWFCGGNGSPNPSNGPFSNIIDRYNNNLTKLSTLSLSQARGNGAAASTNTHFIIAGYETEGLYTSDVVDAFDSTGTRFLCTTMPSMMKNYGGSWTASAATNHMFIYSSTGLVSYDENLTQTILLLGSPAGSNAPNGSYIVHQYGTEIASGVSGIKFNNNAILIGGYANNLTARAHGLGIKITDHGTISYLPETNHSGIASCLTPLGNKLLIAGATSSSSTIVSDNSILVDSLSITDTITAETNLTYPRASASGVTVGKFALIAGGKSGDSDENIFDQVSWGTYCTVEAYKIF